MSKLSVFGLSKEAYQFVRNNMPSLMEHIKIFLPMILVLKLVQVLSAYYDYGFVTFGLFVVAMIVYALFALSWHRVSLQGASKAEIAMPHKMGKVEWAFVGLFFVMILIPFAGGAVIGFSGGMIRGYHERIGQDISGGTRGIMAVVFLALIFFIMTLVTRLSFVLPARSVGVSLSFKDAWRASKGTVWPFLGSNIVFILFFVLVLVVYTVAASVVMAIASGGVQSEAETLSQHLARYVMTIPVEAGALMVTAVIVSSLSFAYQWGIQNNPIEHKPENGTVLR